MEMPAQTGKDRFGVMSPATGSNLENPVRLASRLGGQDLKSVALPRSAHQLCNTRVRVAGRNRRFPHS